MKIQQQFIMRALDLSDRSPQRGFRVGSVLTNGKTILSEGVNHLSTMRLKQVFSTHAELAALAKARHYNLRGATIYIANKAKSGNIRLAKPCVVCAAALSSAGVRYAIYTIDNNNIGVCDLDAETELYYCAADGEGYRDNK